MSGIFRGAIAGLLMVALTVCDAYARGGLRVGRGGSVRVRGSSGSVRVGSSGSVRVGGSGGSVRVGGGSGSVRVRGSSGNVRVSGSRSHAASHYSPSMSRGHHRSNHHGDDFLGVPDRPSQGRPRGSDGKHRHYHSHYGGGRYDPHYWRRWASAGAVSGWITHRWDSPVYSSYGSGGNVYYENEVVHVDGERYAAADEYYEQASTIATDLPEMTEEQAQELEWLPLGVFAIFDELSGEYNRVLQLAVTREGVITGMYHNEATGSERPVEGMINSETQRAAWTFADGVDTHIVMETSIYNLTEDKTQILVHFGADTTQAWWLARLDEEED